MKYEDWTNMNKDIFLCWLYSIEQSWLSTWFFNFFFSGSSLVTHCRPLFSITELYCEDNSVVVHCPLKVHLTIYLNCLQPIQCQQISVSIRQQFSFSPESSCAQQGGLSATDLFQTEAKLQKNRCRHESKLSAAGIDYYNHAKMSVDTLCENFRLNEYFLWRPDGKVLSSCGIELGMKFSPSDSNHAYQQKPVVKDDYQLCVKVENSTLQPGANDVELCYEVGIEGWLFQIKRLVT